MPKQVAIRLYAFAGLTAALLLLASPASAQFVPRPLNDPATGETYHIEGGVGFWFPGAQTNRGYAGFLVEAKYTDVQVQLDSPITSEFARAQAPIPALGGIGRVYVVPNISITVDISGFKLPEKLIKGSTGHYIDVDVYG